MTKQILNEGLDYMDLEGQIEPRISVDEYSAKMGKDSEIVTIAFTVKSEAAGNDLVDWLERGYNFVLDAQVSEGEIKPGKFLVFVEMDRRTTVPERIVEILNDLETLTGMSAIDYTVEVDEEEYDADEDILKQKIILSPKAYRVEEEREEELNEMREIAGLDTVKIHNSQDIELKNFKAIAGL
jgi:hypothetical protein